MQPVEPAPTQQVEEPEERLSERQRASRGLDAKIREAWQSGETNHAEIARRLEVSPSTIGISLRRQGIVKKSHPIQSLEKRARETADDFASFMGQPELYRDGADDEDREQCIKSLRALNGAVSRAINWLKRDSE
jgi:hypothetical protein